MKNLFKSLFNANTELNDENLTPKFIGSKAEFNKYFGPRLRNQVQYIAKNYKTQIGKCQHCGVVKERGLDAAHVHGKERTVLMNQVLSNFEFKDYYKVNLHDFEQQFIALHKPIEEVILVLCKDCHRKYDSKYKERKKQVKNTPTATTKRISSGYDQEPRKGGKFNNKEIQIKITEAAQHIPQEELDRLCDPEYSKRVFNNNYAIFVRLPLNTNTEIRQKIVRDQNDIARWTWKYEFERNGYCYAVSTQWYNWNDDQVLKWLRKFAK